MILGLHKLSVALNMMEFCCSCGRDITALPEKKLASFPGLPLPFLIFGRQKRKKKH